VQHYRRAIDDAQIAGRDVAGTGHAAPEGAGPC
jgi:hypothetical protein